MLMVKPGGSSASLAPGAGAAGCARPAVRIPAVRLLAADIGNTNVTIGLFKDDRLAGSWRATTRPNATVDEVAATVGQLLALDGRTTDELDAVDVVSADGAYLGGAIAPGMALSLEALVGQASKLPRIELRRPPSAIGANTVHAMQSGTVLGYIGLVSGLLTSLRTELLERSPESGRVTVVATGGYTHQPWLRDVPGIDAVEPDLTLRGIRYAWSAMRDRRRVTERSAQA